MFKYFTRALGKYATFRGRARRKEFWSFLLFAALLKGFLQNFHGGIIGDRGSVEELVGLLLFVPTVTVTVRRLHDLDRSGWWILLAPTGIGTIILAIMLAAEGTHGGNEYGPDPKAGYDDDDRGCRGRGRRRGRGRGRFGKRPRRNKDAWGRDEDQYV